MTFLIDFFLVANSCSAAAEFPLTKLSIYLRVLMLLFAL